ncbi:MAG: N,N-dimethylformamidase beta subunit family domain-containing protein [Caulobacteraceae bacterium]
MTAWPSLPRRVLLRLAGAGIVAAPLPALAQNEGGAAPASPPAPEAWTAFFKSQRIWAYADRTSLHPGESLNVMAAGGPGQPLRRARLEVFRLGAAEPEKVWVSDFADVAYRGATASAAAIGPGWPATWPAIDTRAWRPGCYTCDIVEQTTATRDVRACQWIVANPARSGAVLCRLGTNTYQAYNPWGGHSLYPNGDDERRGLMVSFDRPAPPSFFEYDAFLVAWLEGLAASLGGVDYAGNFDVHADPALMDPYHLVICGGHDEYWSKEEFDAFQHRIFTQGRNTAFFGADAAYCQVRYGDLNRAPGGADLGRQLVCYKTASDPIAARAGKLDPSLLITANFRQGARRPETMLMGSAFQNWFDAASPARPAYKVARTDLPFFAGTGWKVGDTAAEVVGYEWDNRDPLGDGARLWDAVRSRIAAIDPARISVLFRGEAIGADGRPGVAEATWFVSPAGAKVFNAGSVRWSWGLGKEGFARPAFRTFNENLARYLAGR